MFHTARSDETSSHGSLWRIGTRCVSAEARDNASMLRVNSLLTFSLLACLATAASAQTATAPSDRAAWMADAKFGVMNHYLADWIARRENIGGGRLTVEQWNEMVDAFDVERLPLN